MIPYSLHVAAGETGAFHDVLSPTFAGFLPGLPLYLSFDYAATRSTGTDAATLHVELRWYDATGAALTPWTQDIIINATIADTLQKFVPVPPVNATSGKFYIKVTPAASPMQHDVWIKKLRLGKTEISATNGANWASNVSSRPANLAALSGTEGVNNSLVSIGSNGALTGAGGGQVTLPGIAPNVDAAASASDNILRNANFATDTSYWTLTGASVSRAAGTATAPPRLIFTCDGSNPHLWSEWRPIPPGARKLFLSYDINRTDINFGAAVYMTIVFLDAQGNPTSYTKNDFYGADDAEIVHLQNGIAVSQLTNAWVTAVYTNIVVPIQAVQMQVQIMAVNGAGVTPAPTIQMTNIRLSPTAPAADLTTLNSVVNSSEIGAAAADNLIKNALYQQLDAAGNVAFWKLDTGCTFQTSATSGEPPKYIHCTTSGHYATPNSSSANLISANSGIAMWPGGPKKLYLSALVRTQALYLGVTIYLYRAGGFVTSLGCALQPTAANTWQECTGVIDASAYDFDAYQMFIGNVDSSYSADFADLRMAFTERAATLGAIWNGNIVGTPTNLGALSGSEGINNGLVAIGSNGALTGGGGGQVTIGGLGYGGDLNATANRITYSNTAPATPGNGDIWVDTSVTPNVTRVRVAGAWQISASYVSNTNQITDGANLGGTAAWLGVNSRPANLAALSGSEGINNGLVSVGSNGALLGGGGGQVTIGGLGGGPWATETRATSALWSPGSNVVFNGGLRLLGALGWTLGSWGYSAPTVSADGAFIYIVAAGSNFAYSNTFPVLANATYGYQAEFNLVNATAGSMVMDIEWQNSFGAVISYSSAIGYSAGQAWTRAFSTAVAPATATKARLRVYTNSSYTNNGNGAAARRFKVSLGSTDVGFSDEATNSVSMLTTPGSGSRIGDQRNMPVISAQNLSYRNTGAVSYSSTYVNTTTSNATISIAASTSYIGSASVSYNAMSTATLTGTPGTTVTYYIYADDPSYAGGTPSGGLQSTTDPNVIFQNDGRVYLGSASVNFATSSGSTGGTGTGGGGGCPHEDEWLETLRGFVQAKDVLPGDFLRVLSPDGSHAECWEMVQSNTFVIDRGYRITAESGCSKRVTQATPLTLRDGTTLFPHELGDNPLPVNDEGRFAWERCSAEPIGNIPARKIACANKTFAGGTVAGRSVFTHNQKPAGN